MTSEVISVQPSISSREKSILQIESDDLRSKLQAHDEFLEQVEPAFILRRNTLLKGRISELPVEYRRLSSDNSVLDLIVRALMLSYQLPESCAQLSEISESDFIEALTVLHWDFTKIFKKIQDEYLSLSACSFYFSYVLTLISVRELLTLILEVNRMAESSESVDIELVLKIAEKLSKDEYKDYPIEWLLRVD